MIQKYNYCLSKSNQASCSCDKTPGKRWKGARKRRNERTNERGWSHCIHTQEAGWGSACFLLFTPSGIPVHEMTLVTFRVCLSTSVQATKKPPDTPEVSLPSVSRPAKVTIRVSYHIYDILKIVFSFNYVYLFGVRAHNWRASRGWKRGLGPLDLELQVIVKWMLEEQQAIITAESPLWLHIRKMWHHLEYIFMLGICHLFWARWILAHGIFQTECHFPNWK